MNQLIIKLDFIKNNRLYLNQSIWYIMDIVTLDNIKAIAKVLRREPFLLGFFTASISNHMESHDVDNNNPYFIETYNAFLSEMDKSYLIEIHNLEELE
jgi:hypothetical protein